MDIQESVTKLSPKDGDILVFKVSSPLDSQSIVDMLTGMGRTCGIIILQLDESIEILSTEDMATLGLRKV